MTPSGRLFALIRNAMLKSVTVRGTIYMVRSVTKLSSHTSNIRLPVKHVFMQQLKMSGQDRSCANSAKLALAWSSRTICHRGRINSAEQFEDVSQAHLRGCLR